MDKDGYYLIRNGRGCLQMSGIFGTNVKVSDR